MEGMNYVGRDPRWQEFEGPDTGHLQDSSLLSTALDYAFHTVSPPPQTATEYPLEPNDTLAQDCIPTPVSLDGDLDVPFSDPTSVFWTVSHVQEFDLQFTSYKSNAQDAAKGMKKEVSLGSRLIPSCHSENRTSDYSTETSCPK